MMIKFAEYAGRDRIVLMQNFYAHAFYPFMVIHYVFFSKILYTFKNFLAKDG